MSKDVMQLRIGLEKKDVMAIFAEKEISQKLNEFLADSKENVSDLVSVCKKLLVSLPNNELKRETIKSNLISDNKIMNTLQDTFMYRILHMAVQKALCAGMYDIKQNIINTFSKENSDGLQVLLKECVISTISSLTEYEYDDILRQTFL